MATVRIPGARAENDAFRREPPLREIERDGQTAPLCAAISSTSLGERGRKLHRGASIGAGGMPPSAFSTGDRIGAFVDDGVEPATLLSDVALHGDASSDRHGAQPVEDIGGTGAFLQVKALSTGSRTPTGSGICTSASPSRRYGTLRYRRPMRAPVDR